MGFPWSHYAESLFVPAGVAVPDAGTGAAGGTPASEHDVLAMVFGSREIILRGRNLARVHEAIVRHRVHEIRELPEKFLSAAPIVENGVPLVVEITVRERGK